jgi:hypothetical protein
MPQRHFRDVLSQRWTTVCLFPATPRCRICILSCTPGVLPNPADIGAQPSANWSALASKRPGSSKKIKFSRRNGSGTASLGARRQTIGANRLLSDAA